MADTINGKRLNMEIDFSANTQKARKEIAELQKQLNGVLNNAAKSTGEFSVNKELHEASRAAVELKRHLSNALNVDTGKFDISDFNKSLKQSGKTLEDYRIQLNKLEGGREAFNSIAKSILNAEVPLRKTNKLLNEFATTLKNTARWQISSSLLHGFMGSLQSAFGYAKDLNESLNNIRIVTGQNVDQMAKFATEANKAAQALSTTTTAYTDASLIYYQQGLSDEEVKRRTETTIKMANVSRQSAEEVSSQMTAVWNNFNKAGDQSTDHFADIMTALGAKTASSSSEIAEGLSKFAGIADTVGLSFDYAASALATITATSRESADVVGTSLKTIFSRLEGLKLGETLDDGTQLNQYSAALEKIGVNIKDASGELKSMDTILEETGQRWRDLTEDQKMATAQTVAGVRQYNQFITLMDNWDFMEQNLKVSKDAEGTLQEQADIYAESWEAAEKRVKAAFEEIYSKILDDDFFIDLNNGFADFLGIISNTIDALGGLQGVISGIGLLITTLYKDQLANTLNNFFTTQEQKRKEWAASQEDALDNLYKNSTSEEQKEAYSGIRDATKKLLDESKNLTVEQEKQARLELQQIQNRAKEIEQYDKEVQLAKSKTKELEKAANKATDKAEGKTIHRQNIKKGILATNNENQEEVKNALNEFDSFSMSQQNFSQAVAKSSVEYEKLVELIGKTKADKYVEARMAEIQALDEEAAAAERLEENLFKIDEAEGKLSGAVDDAGNAVDEFNEHLDDMQKQTPEMGEVIVGLAQGAMSLSMAFSSLKGLGDIWSDNDMSTGEKLLSTITSMSMAAPMLISGFKGLKEAVSGFGPALVKLAAQAVVAGAAEEGATISSIGWGAALKGVGAAAWSALGPIALVIAAATALGFAISAISDAYNADANAAKDAAEAAVELANNYNTVKTAYQDLQDTLADYNDAKQALTELTTGTEEWKNAVSELNDKVLNLLSSYPELAKYVSNVNGVLELSTAGQNALLEAQQKNVNKAYQSNLAGQINKGVTQNKSDITDLSRELGGGNSEIYKSLIDIILPALESNGNAILANSDALMQATGISDEYKEYVDKIVENSGKLEELSNTISANTEANKLYTQELGKGILESKGYDTEKTSDALVSYIGNKVSDKFTNEKVDEYKDKWLGKNDSTVQEEYARYMGYQESRNLDDDMGEYLVDGEWTQIADSVARNALALRDAEEEISGDLTDLINQFNDLHNSLKDITGSNTDADNLMNYLQGNLNFDDLTEAEVQTLLASKDNIQNISEELQNTLGLTEEEIQNKIDGLNNNLLSNISEYIKQYPIAVQRAFDEFDTSGMTQGGQKALADVLNKAIVLGGEQSKQSLDAIFNEAQKNGTVKEFGELLNNIDWETTDVGSFKDSLKEVGANADLTDNQLENLISNMRITALETEDLSTKYSEIHKIIDGLKEGDTISAEDYDKLGEYAGNYFTKMLDGTYKLTIDAEKFYKATQKGLINEAKENLNNYDDKLTTLNKINNENYNLKYLSQDQSIQKTGYYGGSSLEQKTSFDTDNIQKQIDLVKALGDESQETEHKIKDWQFALDNNEISIEMTKELADEVFKLNDEYEDIPSAIKAITEERKAEIKAIYETATSVKELDEITKQVGLDQDLYNKEVLKLNEQNRLKDLDTEDVKDYGKYLQELAGQEEKTAKIGNQKLAPSLEKNEKKAKSLATQIQRMNNGVESLAENWKDWSKILKDGSEGADEHRKAVEGTRKAIANLADVSEDYVSLDFVESLADNTENLELMKKAAKGDAKAIDELKSKLSDDIVSNIVINNLDFKKGSEKYNEVIEAHNNLKSLLDKKLTLKIGAKIDDKWTEAANKFIKQTKMTVDQANSYFRSLGVEPHFKTVYKTIKTKKPITRTVTKDTSYSKPIYGQDGHRKYITGSVPMIQSDTYSYTTGYKTVEEKVAVPAISSDGKEPNVTFTEMGNGSVNNSSSYNPGGGSGSKGSSGGGGGSKGSSTKMSQMKRAKDKPEKRDPYWDENLAISKTERKLNENSEKLSYTFGKEKAKLLQEQNKLLKEQLKNYKALGEEQEKQEKKLRKKAGKGVKVTRKKNGELGELKDNTGLGLKVKYDKDGYISNYDSVYKQTIDRFKKEKQQYNDFQEKWTKEMKEYNKKIKNKNLSKEDRKELEKEKEKWEKRRRNREQDWENEKELYKIRKDWIDEYTETEEAKQERLEQERQEKREQIENNIEKWDIEVQFDIDTREAERSWKKFIDKASKALKSVMSHFSLSESANNISFSSNEIRGLTKDYQAKQSQYQTYEWIASHYDQYVKMVPEAERLVSSQSEAVEKAKEYKKELEEIGEKVMNELQQGWNEYLDALDQGKEAFDMINEKLKTQGDILEYNKQMLELVYGDQAYDKMEQYYQGQDQYLKAQQGYYKQQQDYWLKQYEDAKKLQAANNEAFNEHDMTTWSEAMIKTYNNAQEAAANLRDTNLAYVQNQIDMYDNLVDKEMDAFERSLFGGESLQEAKKKWEREKKEADLYLDETERTYQIQSLMNKYDKAINETKEINAVKQLNKLRQAELEQLRKKEKLTQFDLDVANARYELELKRIALEEAQQNKNTMKLTRNAEGNWSYQYVANQDDVDSKAQDVLDAANNWYKMSKENERRTKDETFSTLEDALSEMRDTAHNRNLTDEERMSKLQELADWTSNMTQGLANENYVSIQNMVTSTATLLTTAYETDSKTFEQYNKDKIKFISDLKDQGTKDFYSLFDSFGIYAEKGATRLVTAFMGEEGDTGAFPSIVSSAWDFMLNSDTSLSKAFRNAGDFIIGKFVTDPGSVMDKLTNEKDGAFHNIDDAGKTCFNNISWYITDPENGVNANFGKVNTALGSIVQDMGATEASVTTSLNGIKDKLINDLIPAWKAYWEAANGGEQTDVTAPDAPVPQKVMESATKNTTTQDTSIKTPDTYKGRLIGNTVAGNLYGVIGSVLTGGAVGGAVDNPIKAEYGEVLVVEEKGKYYVRDGITGETYAGPFDKLKKAKESAQKYSNKFNVANPYAGTSLAKYGFATGGYTGSWDGNDGKIAMLHQKELVLNANDTKNMLDAVDTIRDITSLNSSITDSIAKSISGIVAGTAQHMLNGGNITQDVGKNEQYVIENINAEFPNAENVEEIREAIMSLPRLASQYVSRNLK